LAEISLDPFCAADHHMIRAGKAFGRHNLTGKRAEAALHPVADHRSADLFGDGETDAHCRVRILAVADQQNEAWSGRALAGVRGEEIRALFKCD
jgi:hypothetical protein